MINYNTVTQELGETISNCYALATAAYNDHQPDAQTALYKIADALQIQLDALMVMETAQAKNANPMAWSELRED